MKMEGLSFVTISNEPARLYYKMEDATAVRLAMNCIVTALNELQISHINLSFGWGWLLPVDELWIDQRVETGKVVSCVEAMEGTGNGKLGISDVIIEASDGQILIQLTHDSFLICTFSQSSLSQVFVSVFGSSGIEMREQEAGR